jgi:NifU-like protein involved in Fe-S cluster formation
MKTLEYSREAKKHFFNPKYAGEIKNPSAIGQVGNPSCGDVMRVFLKIGKDKKTGKDKIEKIRFKTMGCVAAIASSDVVCELAEGKTIEQARKITRKDILKAVKGLPPIKHHCSLLGEEALNKAIDNWEKKK